MTRPTINQPNLLALRSGVWVAELSLELQRLGHGQAEAERSARSILAHIVGRADWPRQSFIVDDRALPVTEETA